MTQCGNLHLLKYLHLPSLRRPSTTRAVLAAAIILLCGAEVAHSQQPTQQEARPKPSQRRLPRGFLGKTITLSNRAQRKYAVFTPPQYVKDENHKWPLIIFLHGSGECGTDGIKQTTVGLPPYVARRAMKFPFIVVMPQAQNMWFRGQEAEAFAIFVTRRGITPGTAAMESVAATGRAGEFSARSLLESQGEIIVLTQFKRGAANRGFDFLSAARSPNGLEVFLNEVKNSTGLQFPSGLTALGLNRAGTFDANLARAQAAVAEQVTDNALRTGILGALRQQNYSIRIIGRPGIRITPRTESLIQKTAGTTREVIILEALP